MGALTGVGTVISACHRGGDDILHGHSYEVTAWFAAGGDALHLQARLRKAAEPFDHDELLDGLAENIAAELGRLLPDAVQIDVSRPLERLYARWVR